VIPDSPKKEPAMGKRPLYRDLESKVKDLENALSIAKVTIDSHADHETIIKKYKKQISDFRKENKALRLSEKRFRSVLEASPNPIVIYDMAGKLEYMNNAFTQVFGWKPEDFMGKKVDFVPEENMPETVAVIKKMFAGEKVDLFRTRRYTKNRAILDVEISCGSFKNRDGILIGTFVILRDVTEQRKMAEALKESEERHASVLMSSPDAIVVYDNDGHVVYMNPAFTKLFGWTLEERKGKKMDIFVPEKDWPETKRLIQKVLSGETFYDVETHRFTKDKKIKEISISGAAFCNSNGEVVGSVSTLRDITERKKAISKIKKLNTALKDRTGELERLNSDLEQAVDYAKMMTQAAEEANKSKSEFLANMSHEIRTPMNAIIGMSGILDDTDLDQEQKECVDIVRGSSEALLSIINDILDFSKIEAGKLELELLDFDLRSTLDEIVSIPAVIAVEKGLEILFDIDQEIPSRLKGDPGRLRQIILNLTNNAVKFTKKGEILLKVRMLKETQKEVKLKFSVKDTGIGIAKKDLTKLFNSFQQVDASTTRRYGGTGLGLVISKMLSELMGGEIQVESQEGIGSVFWFTAIFEKQLDVQEIEQVLPEELANKRIMVVDDNKTNLSIIRRYLKSWGYDCDTVWDPNIALTMMQAAARYKAPYDIVISDWQMPHMSGTELGEQIKNDPRLEKTVMIMLSSRGMRGDAAKAKKIGFAAYLTKPIKSSQLFDCLITVLSKNKNNETKAEPQLVTQHTITADRLKKIRILLAEDNIMNQKVVLKLMGKWGFKIDAVANGKEAVKALELIPYNVVLMDVQMPEMDGFEATRVIRSPEESNVLDHNVLIIAMTAHAMKGDRERCLDAGMDDYISKPIKAQEFYRVLHKQLLDKDESHGEFHPNV